MGKIHHLPVNRVLLPGENKTCLKKLKVINDVNDYDDIHRDGYHSETDGGDDDDGDVDGDDDEGDDNDDIMISFNDIMMLMMVAVNMVKLMVVMMMLMMMAMMTMIMMTMMMMMKTFGRFVRKPRARTGNM